MLDESPKSKSANLKRSSPCTHGMQFLIQFLSSKAVLQSNCINKEPANLIIFVLLFRNDFQIKVLQFREKCKKPGDSQKVPRTIVYKYCCFNKFTRSLTLPTLQLFFRQPPTFLRFNNCHRLLLNIPSVNFITDNLTLPP